MPQQIFIASAITRVDMSPVDSARGSSCAVPSSFINRISNQLSTMIEYNDNDTRMILAPQNVPLGRSAMLVPTK